MLACYVCVLNEDEARLFKHGGMRHKCRSRRHQHYHKREVEELVRAGDLVWLGKHKRVATFLQSRSWVKTYRRNESGEVISCGMQLVRGDF